MKLFFYSTLYLALPQQLEIIQNKWEPVGFIVLGNPSQEYARLTSRGIGGYLQYEVVLDSALSLLYRSGSSTLRFSFILYFWTTCQVIMQQVMFSPRTLVRCEKYMYVHVCTLQSNYKFPSFPSEHSLDHLKFMTCTVCVFITIQRYNIIMLLGNTGLVNHRILLESLVFSQYTVVYT